MKTRSPALLKALCLAGALALLAGCENSEQRADREAQKKVDEAEQARRQVPPDNRLQALDAVQATYDQAARESGMSPMQMIVIRGRQAQLGFECSSIMLGDLRNKEQSILNTIAALQQLGEQVGTAQASIAALKTYDPVSIVQSLHDKQADLKAQMDKLSVQIGQVNDAITANQTTTGSLRAASGKAQDAAANLDRRAEGETGDASVRDVISASDLRRDAGVNDARADALAAQLVELKNDLQDLQMRFDALKASSDMLQTQAQNQLSAWDTIQKQIEAQSHLSQNLIGSDANGPMAADDKPFVSISLRAGQLGDDLKDAAALRDTLVTQLTTVIGEFGEVVAQAEKLRQDTMSKMSGRGEKDSDYPIWQQTLETMHPAFYNLQRANALQTLAVVLADRTEIDVKLSQMLEGMALPSTQPSTQPSTEPSGQIGLLAILNPDVSGVAVPKSVAALPRPTADQLKQERAEVDDHYTDAISAYDKQYGADASGAQTRNNLREMGRAMANRMWGRYGLIIGDTDAGMQHLRDSDQDETQVDPAFRDAVTTAADDAAAQAGISTAAAPTTARVRQPATIISMFLRLLADSATLTPLPTDDYFGSTLRAWVDRPCIAFGGDAWAYAHVQWVLLGLTIVLAFCARRSSSNLPDQQTRPRNVAGVLRSWPVFAAAMVLTLFFCRWPAITLYDKLGLDESVMLAGAMTLKHDPLFWRTVQSTTAGPLDYYPLLTPALFGMPLDYAAARLVNVALTAATLVVALLICRTLMDELSARLSVLPAWCFWCAAFSPDFVQYTSEIMPIFLLSLSTLLATRWIVRGCNPSRPRWMFASAFLAGCLPLAKVQSSPAALAIGLGLLLSIFAGPTKTADKRQRAFRTLGLIGFSILPAMLVLALVGAAGLGSRFYHAFIEFQLDFAAAHHQPFQAEFAETFSACFHVPMVGILAWSLCISLAMMLLVSIFFNAGKLFRGLIELMKRRGPLVVIFAGTPILLFFAIMQRQGVGTTWYYFHYFLFLVLPLTLLAMMSIDWMRGHVLSNSVGDSVLAKWWKGAPRLAQVIAVAIPSVWLVWNLPMTAVYYLKDPDYYLADNRTESAIYIWRHTLPSDSLVVWGWRPDLYVESQRRQAVSFATAEREIGSSGVRDKAYFRQQFMRDIERNQPAMVIDSTGPADVTYFGRSLYSHEVVMPEFKQFLHEHYKTLGELDHFRFYVRINSAVGQSQPSN